MEEIIYHKTSSCEDSHWWFLGRRSIVGQVLDRLHLPEEVKILEVGCGTGGNLPLLAGYGKVYGLEPEDTARRYAQQKSKGTILAGSLPDEIPFKDQSFDLIVLTDVLEHVVDDGLSLQRLYPLLKNGGYILITVPAFPSLWSQHDESHHHKRRYTLPVLRSLLLHSGYVILESSYINFFLFPLIAGMRVIKNFFRKTAADDLKTYPAVINLLLAKLFASEGFLLRYVSFPFGVSLLGVGQKIW